MFILYEIYLFYITKLNIARRGKSNFCNPVLRGLALRDLALNDLAHYDPAARIRSTRADSYRLARGLETCLYRSTHTN